MLDAKTQEWRGLRIGFDEVKMTMEAWNTILVSAWESFVDSQHLLLSSGGMYTKHIKNLN